MHSSDVANTDAAILSRLFQNDQTKLSPEAARSLLTMRFPQFDVDRMHELAVKNQDGELTEAEQCELDSYRRVGRLLDLLSSKARLFLHHRGLSA